MTTPIVNNNATEFSLSTSAARLLSTTTKSAPQMPGLTSRSLLKILAWVEAKGGAYQVNRIVNDPASSSYGIQPRTYELNPLRTILRIQTLVADLMNLTEQQLSLAVEELRERQEFEMINNPDFGLLHNAHEKCTLSTRNGTPSPDDFDDLLIRIREPQFLLAHPKTIAALAWECNRLGLSPQSVELGGHLVPAWRSVPLLPCTKIPVSHEGITSVIVLRTGEANQGVIGLHQTGIPDEYESGLNVRFMGIDENAVISYLVSTYFSVALLAPDAIGILNNIKVG